MTDADRKKRINNLVDQIDACTRACHDRNDAALERALDDLLNTAILFRLHVRESMRNAKP